VRGGTLDGVRFSVCIGSVRGETVAETIESVVAQTFIDWELVVVGQGATPSPVEDVVRQFEDIRAIRYVQIPQRGLSRARNEAVRVTTGEVIAFLDDDCIVPPDWLERLDEVFSSDQDVGLVAGALVAPEPDRRRFAVCPHVLPEDVVYQADGVSFSPPRGFDMMGGSLAMRRSLIERVGLMDEALGAGGEFPMCEETDYLFRAERVSARMRSTPKVVVLHKHGWRYGPKAMWRIRRDAAAGWGGFAAKLDLIGDPRGREMYRWNTVGTPVENLRTLRLHRLPMNLLRAWMFRRAFRRCRAEFDVSLPRPVDKVRAVLVPRTA
jgi:GT2 family glycosyltransferase